MLASLISRVNPSPGIDIFQNLVLINLFSKKQAILAPISVRLLNLGSLKSQIFLIGQLQKGWVASSLLDLLIVFQGSSLVTWKWSRQVGASNYTNFKPEYFYLWTFYHGSLWWSDSPLEPLVLVRGTTVFSFWAWRSPSCLITTNVIQREWLYVFSSVLNREPLM